MKKVGGPVVMGYLKIGELASLAGTNNETLRFYETRGLIDEPRRTEAGYRLYTETDVARVKFIMRAKRMGFALTEIAELLSLRVTREESTCGEVKELAEMKLQAIDEKIEELQRMKSALTQITDACVGGEESAVHCTILNALDDVDDACHPVRHLIA